MRSISELDVAAHLGLEIACRVLSESECDINSRDALEITPLHRAASMGHAHVVKLLLDKGADIAARSHDLLSPLGSAAKYGHEPVARMLLEHDADGKMTQPEKMRVLYDALFGGHQAICRLLLEKNFDGTLDNTTLPVHTMVASRDMTALKHLLSGEVDINVKGQFGLTPRTLQSHRMIYHVRRCCWIMVPIQGFVTYSRRPAFIMRRREAILTSSRHSLKLGQTSSCWI
jgi:hypothetical protein